MAVFVMNFTQSKGAAKANIKYIQHRPGKDRVKATRTLFGWDGAMGRYEAYRMVDAAAKGSSFFRIKISPDPKTENTKRTGGRRQHGNDQSNSPTMVFISQPGVSPDTGFFPA